MTTGPSRPDGSTTASGLQCFHLPNTRERGRSTGSPCVAWCRVYGSTANGVYPSLRTVPKRPYFLFGPRGTVNPRGFGNTSRPVPATNCSIQQMRLAADPAILARETARIRSGGWVVFDEIQEVPALLDEVHRLIESRRLRFLLLRVKRPETPSGRGQSARRPRRRQAHVSACLSRNGRGRGHRPPDQVWLASRGRHRPRPAGIPQGRYSVLLKITTAAFQSLDHEIRPPPSRHTAAHLVGIATG